MSVAIEGLFTSALGLQTPWSGKEVKLDTSRRRIDFNLTCITNRMPCPHCAAHAQGVHDRLSREWRRLDFFQFENWMHDEVPRFVCSTAARPARLMSPGRAKAVALRRCLKPLPCRSGRSCRCARLQRCSGARTNNCGGALRTMWA